jgi:TolB-like protein/DNA-binding winged helix-turn-helix (wHTH) protein/Tfp pilus assembly protein PilF
MPRFLKIKKRSAFLGLTGAVYFVLLVGCQPVELSRPLAAMIYFGGFELDPRTGELNKNGLRIRLPEQSLQVLALLLNNPGEMVTREELCRELWPNGTFVDFDHGLNAAVNRLRVALHDSAEEPRFIETVARRGYRFIAPVQTGAADSSLQAAAPTSSSTTRATVETPPLQMGDTGARQGAAALTRRRIALTAGALVALLVALLGLSVAGLRERAMKAIGVLREPPLRIQSIAVLPLENLSHDPEQEYFADGMTEALITDLGKISALRVISRTSVMHYKRTVKTLPEIARELNVDALVEGAVMRSGNRVRITAQLIQAATDKHLWAESYERDARDVLALQDEVARNITAEIQIKLTPQQQARLASAGPVNPEAHELYLKGRYEWNKRTEEGLKKGIQYFEKAIAKDPNYAVSYAGLADSYGILADNGFCPPEECYPKATAAAQKALGMDDSLAEAHSSLAQILQSYDWDWSGAEKEIQRAIELNPGYATAHHYYALFLSNMGRPAGAIVEIRKARELDPLSIRINANVGLVLYFAREYEQAVEELRKAIELDPNDVSSHYYLGAVYSHKGMHEEAIAEAQMAQELSAGKDRTSELVLAYAYAAGGRKSEGLKILADLKNPARRSYLPPEMVAEVYAGLGDRQEALNWLEKAYAEHAANLDLLKVNPAFDPLRADPRFQQLLRRMNFPQ